jgi:hypothetical protein
MSCYILENDLDFGPICVVRKLKDVKKCIYEKGLKKGYSKYNKKTNSLKLYYYTYDRFQKWNYKSCTYYDISVYQEIIISEEDLRKHMKIDNDASIPDEIEEYFEDLFTTAPFFIATLKESRTKKYKWKKRLF